MNKEALLKKKALEEIAFEYSGWERLEKAYDAGSKHQFEKDKKDALFIQRNKAYPMAYKQGYIAGRESNN
jgi:hypothetical protein